MRTSRVSRDTVQVLKALSPQQRNVTRRSLRAVRDVEDEMSTTVSGSLESDRVSPDAEKVSLGKRRRESSHATPVKKLAVEDTVGRSPRKAVKTEDGDNAEDSGERPRKPRRQPAKHIKGVDGTTKVEPPPNWERVYDVTAEMRKRLLAPVDTMGCESLAEQHASPKDQRLQTLVSLMLSSQTKDSVTAAAMRNLQANLPGGFCLDSLLQVEPAALNRLIEKVGFHNNKTKYIQSMATILRDKFDGDIPSTIEGLVSLPGVGPKMAYLCMSAAWGRDEGIGVDVHVHRISNLWGWHKTRSPEETRAELEAWLPREKWHEINRLLVGFGQTLCLPVGRRCGECDLAAQGLCPSAEVRTVSPAKKEKRVQREVEVKVEGGEVQTVKEEELVVAADDVGVKVEADLAGEGQIERQGTAGDAHLAQAVT